MGDRVRVGERTFEIDDGEDGEDGEERVDLFVVW